MTPAIYGCKRIKNTSKPSVFSFICLYEPGIIDAIPKHIW